MHFERRCRSSAERPKNSASPLDCVRKIPQIAKAQKNGGNFPRPPVSLGAAKGGCGAHVPPAPTPVVMHRSGSLELFICRTFRTRPFRYLAGEVAAIPAPAFINRMAPFQVSSVLRQSASTHRLFAESARCSRFFRLLISFRF